MAAKLYHPRVADPWAGDKMSRAVEKAVRPVKNQVKTIIISSTGQGHQ